LDDSVGKIQRGSDMSGRYSIFLAFPLIFSNFFLTSIPQPLLAARQERKVEKGVFLVADLRLTDPNFSKTVVLITQHGPGGSVGVVINRPTRTPLSRAFPEIKELEQRPEKVFIGGPVQREVMTLLFQTEKPSEAAVPIFEKVYAAPPIETLTHLAPREDVKDPFRVYSGYAGWAPGQLQGEIDRGDWRVLPGEADLIFQEETVSIWEEMFRRSSQQWVHCSDACVAPPLPGHRIKSPR
jgi:putative transcriptional regulator